MIGTYHRYLAALLINPLVAQISADDIRAVRDVIREDKMRGSDADFYAINELGLLDKIERLTQAFAFVEYPYTDRRFSSQCQIKALYEALHEKAADELWCRMDGEPPRRGPAQIRAYAREGCVHADRALKTARAMREARVPADWFGEEGLSL